MPYTAELFDTGRSRKFRAIEKVAKRKLYRIDSAEKLEDLAVPPGNRLEALKGDRYGCHSIRINGRFRLCFRWSDGPEDVEIVDDH